MAGGKAGSIALALALGIGGHVALAASVIDAAAARRIVARPAVAAIDARIDALASQARADDLAAQLDLVAHDRTLPDVAQEWLLDRGLHALARLEPTSRSRDSVSHLARRAPLVYARIDPDHGEHLTPLYDTGATARFVLRTWDRGAARRAAEADFAAGRTSAVARLAAQPGSDTFNPVRTGIADAFAAASPAALAVQRGAIVDAIAQGRRVDELTLVLAERLADAALYRLVLDHGDGPVALVAISRVSRALDPQTAFSELALASRRADISSAAILAIGRLAKNDAIARAFLFDALDAPDTGPSAAAALAAIGDPAIATELGRRLAEANTEEARRLHVLALRLDRSGGGHAELARFASSRAGSVELRNEVRQWLTR